MNYLTADPLLLNRLRGIREPVAIRDPSGNVLGQFTPRIPESDAALHARADALFDLAEAERVLATESQGSSLREIVQRLQSLEPKG